MTLQFPFCINSTNFQRVSEAVGGGKCSFHAESLLTCHTVIYFETAEFQIQADDLIVYI